MSDAPKTIFREIIIPVAQGAMIGFALIALIVFATLSLAVGICERDNGGNPCMISISVNTAPIPE